MNFDSFDERLRLNYTDREGQEAALRISQRIPGWSGHGHYAFFKSMLEAFPIRNVLIVGVYMGRDIAYMLAGSPRPLRVTGVDKFSDTPCDDWPEEKRGMTWEQAGFGPAPSVQLAEANIAAKPPHAVQLHAGNDADILETLTGVFDLVYLDTAHDKATVLRQLQQVRRLTRATSIIAGDDYENIHPTWGVKDAVCESFRSHSYIPGASIWYAGRGDLK